MSDGAPLQELLSEIIDHRGRTPKKLGAGFAQTGIPVVSAKSVKGGRIDLSETRFIDDALYERWMPRKLRPGDVLLTSEGPLGEVALLRDAQYCLGQRLFALRADPTRLDGQFLFYWLMSARGQQRLAERATGTTVLGIRQSELLKVRVDVPPLDHQRAIAGVLGALDDTIELNRRMNETLERLTREVFAERFLTDRASGWSRVPVSDVCTTQYGYTASSTTEAVGPQFLRVMDINKRPWIDWATVPYCAINESDLRKYGLSRGDIVVARMADPGRAAIIEDDVEAVFASYLVRLKTTSISLAYFLYGFLQSPAYREYAEGAIGGSVQKNMNARVITGAAVNLPPQDEVDAYYRAIEPLRARLAHNVRESRTLAELRDALLPKLISGELRVRDAEAAVEQST